MSTERSIPHLRDVFGLGGYRTPYQQHHSSPSYPVPAHHHQPFQTADNRQMPQTMVSHQQLQQQQVPPTRPQNHSNHNHQQYPTQSSIPIINTAVAGSKPASRRNRDNYKTLTSGDVKTLERHLSMKKTIRKKIMRDLQQAFVDDPTEFKADPNNADRMKSELNLEQAFRFGDSAAANNSDNFLVMLRDDQQHSRHHHQQQQHYRHSRTTVRNSSTNNDTPSPEFASNLIRVDSSVSSNYYDYETDGAAKSAAKSREEKPSFWKRFTFKKKAST